MGMSKSVDRIPSLLQSQALNTTKLCEVLINNHSGKFPGFAKTLAKIALRLLILSAFRVTVDFPHKTESNLVLLITICKAA